MNVSKALIVIRNPHMGTMREYMAAAECLAAELERLRSEWTTCDTCGARFDAARDGCGYCESEAERSEVLRLLASLRPLADLSDGVPESFAGTVDCSINLIRAAKAALEKR